MRNRGGNMRSSMILVAACLAWSGCGSRGGRGADCEPRYRSQEASPGCTADEKVSIAEPIVGLGFQDPYAGNGLPADGTITGIEGTTLHIEAEGRSFEFRWHGTWPIPVALGQQIRLDPLSNAITIDGRTLAVITPKNRVDSRFWAQNICLEPSLGCRASPLAYGVEFELRTPFFQATLPVGQTVQVGKWMVSNPGAVYVPARLCYDVVIGDDVLEQVSFQEEVSGQLLAWTVDPAVLREDPAWCSAAVIAGNQWPGGVSYGYEKPTGGEWVPGTIGHVDRHDSFPVRLALRVEGVFNDFHWPGELPSPLSLGDEVEVAALGEQSALKTASHLLWTSQADGSPGEGIPGTPEVRYEPACLVSNSSQIVAAIVSWEGESVRLLPGETAGLGPWTVVHHHGYATVTNDCNSGGNPLLYALTAATRPLED